MLIVGETEARYIRAFCNLELQEQRLCLTVKRISRGPSLIWVRTINCGVEKYLKEVELRRPDRS